MEDHIGGSAVAARVSDCNHTVNFHALRNDAIGSFVQDHCSGSEGKNLFSIMPVKMHKIEKSFLKEICLKQLFVSLLIYVISTLNLCKMT